MSHWVVTLPSSISVGPHSLPCPPFWCHLEMWQVHSVISCRSLIKTLNKTSPSIVLCSSSLVVTFQVMYNLLASTFWPLPSNPVKWSDINTLWFVLPPVLHKWLRSDSTSREKYSKLESAVTPGTPWAGVYYALLSLSSVFIKIMRIFLPCFCGRSLCKRWAPPKLVIVLGTPSCSSSSKDS